MHCLRMLFLPLVFAASTVAQSSSGLDEIEISRRSADFEGSASGVETFRTLECACVIVEKIEAFAADANETASPDQEEDAYRRRRNADETEGSGSGEDKNGPFAFVHQAGTRSDDPNSIGFVTIHRIVLCKCADDSDEEASGSSDESTEETFASDSGTESSGKDKPQTTASNDGQEESKIYRRSAFRRQAPVASTTAALPVTTAQPPATQPPAASSTVTQPPATQPPAASSTAQTAAMTVPVPLPFGSTVAIAISAPVKPRLVEHSGEEDEAEVVRQSAASGEEDSSDLFRRFSVDTAESSGEEEGRLPTISTAMTPELSTLSTLELSTLVPITRAQRHAEGSGLIEEY